MKLPTCVAFLTVGLTLAFAPSAHAQSDAMTNEDIIALVEGGLGPGVLVAVIRRAEAVSFDLNGGLLDLARSGVPDDVITAMIEKQSVQEAAETAPPPQEAAETAPPPRTAGPAPAAVYSRDQIQAAITIGAEGSADRLQHDCEAELGGTRGFFGRLGGALAINQVRRFVVGRAETPTGVVNAGNATAPLRRVAVNLEPPEEIRVTGQPALSLVAEHAQQERRGYRPVPTPDDPQVLEIIGDDLFAVTALEFRDGIEYIVIRPRGEDDERAIVQPVSLEAVGTTVVAHFPGAAARAIADDADVEAILVTPAGEYKCNLDDRRIRRGYDPLR